MMEQYPGLCDQKKKIKNGKKDNNKRTFPFVPSLYMFPLGPFFQATRTASFMLSSLHPVISVTSPSISEVPSDSFHSQSGPLITLAPLNIPRASTLKDPCLVPTGTLLNVPKHKFNLAGFQCVKRK